MRDLFNDGLPRNAANHVALNPVSFLRRAALVDGAHPAIIHGTVRRTWGETYDRVRRVAASLSQRGVERGDTVAALLPNIPELVEAHFAVPMAGAVLNALNTRLDAPSIRFMLEHGQAKVLLVDREFAVLAEKALEGLGRTLLVIDVADPMFDGRPCSLSNASYDDLVAEGDPQYEGLEPLDEWDAIALNYTSGTTADPKGVVYHHRGAYLNAVSNILEWDLPKHAIYLWTLPMFHCNGWCFPWTIAARGGVNVCLRKVEAKKVFELIRDHGVTHYCGAPIVHGMLASAPAEWRAGIDHPVKGMVAGAPPPAALLMAMKEMNFELCHVYGLTEVYGPSAVCPQQPEWADKDISEQARLNSRQGVRYHLQEDVDVLDPSTMKAVPHDGQTMGEVMFRGNAVMKGYLKNPKGTAEAFAGGWFHTGDLAVRHADGYIKLKDRSKDIIISGGENISSIEIEDVLYLHPAVACVAVVARPDAKWGETPCAFIELRPGVHVTAAELDAHCRQHLAGFKLPRSFEFMELPKTSTGKLQKAPLRARAKSLDSFE